jgi:ribosomal protein S18 acetylase RimI-like enzyme
MNVTRIEPADRRRVEECGRLMVTSEPWLTLGRTFDSAVQTLQDPGKELHAILENDEVAAFILLELRGPLAGYIQSICVRPELRGRGLGTGLLGWAEQYILRTSPNVFLCVSSFNDAARRLYERLGFEVVGRLAGFIVRDHDELLLRKTQGPWAEFRRPPV